LSHLKIDSEGRLRTKLSDKRDDFNFPPNHHGGDRKIFEVMTSTLPKGTLGSVASLLAATPYQENHDRNHKFWNVYQLRYIFFMLVLLECCYIEMESSEWGN
jgi:hypothetical protein